ncbi:hypothetical protein [Longimicrobium terrae]|uniref:Uncharacterized protein n=1 Tax=Longimicrobium terrae TaxID=1639882 RepID=A0A841H0E3_9BACT|nr:hypothetical protein [Longimicrobium terrae]MBB4637208.1 hypothetical protein [Longimicrobium terrae]MBB6071531.1 hypothetical protein [Longimicrobium terrae]NNC30049.1 hypothetical protein [Longimicrobium terrae]
MLAANTYPPEYIDGCRARINAELEAWRSLAGAGGAAVEAFESRFFSTMVLDLDRCFVHRTRGMEGKDGNALNEVRMLCESILQHDGVMTADRTIRYKPESSVLKTGIGERIRIDAAGFAVLADAFFTELQKRFGAPPA